MTVLLHHAGPTTYIAVCLVSNNCYRIGIEKKKSINRKNENPGGFSLCVLCCHCDLRDSLVFHDFSGGRTLQILNAQENSAGRYSCVATNEAGEMMKHYEVKVYSEF